MASAWRMLLAALCPCAHGDLLVPTVSLRNGVQMPLLADGVWQYDDAGAEASVRSAFQVGFRMVDTAYDYHNQAGVGAGVRATGIPRERLFVETKVPGCGMDPAVSKCYDDTKKVLDMDLTLLNMSYVDLVIIHFPPRSAFLSRTCRWSCEQILDQWRAMEEFYAAGKAKAIGVSNYCPSCFECLEGKTSVYPMVNQIQYHIGMGPDPAGFKSFAEKHGVVLQAYSPLGNTPFSHGPNPEILSGKFTTALAEAHGKSTVQVALKYLVQHGVAVVTKSSNPDHLAQDLDLWSWNLTDDEMQQADAFRLAGAPSFACNSADEGIVV